MAKTNRKESRKIYEGYKKRQRLWNTIFIVFFAVIGIGSAVLNGTMELDPQIVIGKYEFTWFHLVILAVLVVLLGFGIVALKRDSSEEQQEIYRQEREEAIRLRQEVMAERKQEMQDAYNAMKRRRAERLAAQGMAPTAAPGRCGGCRGNGGGRGGRGRRSSGDGGASQWRKRGENLLTSPAERTTITA